MMKETAVPFFQVPLSWKPFFGFCVFLFFFLQSIEIDTVITVQREDMFSRMPSSVAGCHGGIQTRTWPLTDHWETFWGKPGLVSRDRIHHPPPHIGSALLLVSVSFSCNVSLIRRPH